VGQKLWKALKNIDDVLSMAAMAFIVLLACGNVFMRYVVGKPWGWAEEVTIFTFVWLSMLGAASVIKAEGHCSIDVLARKLPPGPARALAVIVDIFVILALILLIWYGMKLTMTAGIKLTPMLGIPYTYVDLAIPVSCSFMLVYYLKMLWRSITGKGEKCDTEERR
jgi:TRAP-type C4-dicarboxylate transport system permease small subunit